MHLQKQIQFSQNFCPMQSTLGTLPIVCSVTLSNYLNAELKNVCLLQGPLETLM